MTAEEANAEGDKRSDAKDYTGAVVYYRIAAEQRNAAAQCSLGWCHEKGLGAEQDYATAVRYYRMAADQGNARAQCNLGWCYEKGLGVAQKRSRAVKFYRMAAEQGVESAREALRRLGCRV